MSSKNLVDTRQELADLVKRKHEITVRKLIEEIKANKMTLFFYFFKGNFGQFRKTNLRL